MDSHTIYKNMGDDMIEKIKEEAYISSQAEATIRARIAEYKDVMFSDAPTTQINDKDLEKLIYKNALNITKIIFETLYGKEKWETTLAKKLNPLSER